MDIKTVSDLRNQQMGYMKNRYMMSEENIELIKH